MTFFTTRRFLPLFITQFLGAFNDNLFKNALVMLVAFKLADESTISPQILIIAAGGLFMLPYFLFSATAGQLADKMSRHRLARITKLWEIIVVGIGAVGFIGHHPTFLLAVLFCLGVQSTFFGPVKYALLPQHLREGELVAGNAIIEAGTFLAILLGTIAGGILISAEAGEYYIVAATLAVALLGYAASWGIPAAAAPMPELKLEHNIVKSTLSIVAHDRKNVRVFRAILGISWLWVLGAVFLSQFPTLAKDVIGGGETLVTFFLTMFSLGIGVGSFLSSALVKGKIDSRYVIWGALGIAIFSLDLGLACMGVTRYSGDTPLGVYEFLREWQHVRILSDLFMIALSGGVFVVPLYAIMQHDSDPNYRARTIATCNIVNAFFMVLSAIATGVLVELGCSIPQLFMLMAAVGLMVVRTIRKVRHTSN